MSKIRTRIRLPTKKIGSAYQSEEQFGFDLIIRPFNSRIKSSFEKLEQGPVQIPGSGQNQSKMSNCGIYTCRRPSPRPPGSRCRSCTRAGPSTSQTSQVVHLKKWTLKRFTLVLMGGWILFFFMGEGGLILSTFFTYATIEDFFFLTGVSTDLVSPRLP